MASSVHSLEDFSTFTLFDPGMHLMVDPSKVEFMDLEARYDTYLVNDYGTDYFSGDFTHKFQFRVTSLDEFAEWYTLWAISNHGSGRTGGGDVSLWGSGDTFGGQYGLTLQTKDYNMGGIWPLHVGTTYNVTITRTDVGATSTYNCIVTTVAGLPVDSCSATDPSTYTYRYLYMPSVYDAGAAEWNFVSGFVENLDLGPRPGPSNLRATANGTYWIRWDWDALSWATEYVVYFEEDDAYPTDTHYIVYYPNASTNYTVNVGGCVMLECGENATNTSSTAAPESYTSIPLDKLGFNWTQSYSGDLESIDKTTDGGYIIAGTQNNQVLLLKTNSFGGQEWSRVFGTSGTDAGYSVQQTTDGGYIITGRKGTDEVWVIKTDSSGTPEWNETASGTGPLTAGGLSVIETASNDYVIAGRCMQATFEVTAICLFCFNSSGGFQWRHIHVQPPAGSMHAAGQSIYQTSDGGFIIGGYSVDVLFHPYSAILIKLSSSGSHQWTRWFTGTTDIKGYSAYQTADGGFILAGTKGGNAWLLKTTSAGIEEWNKTYGSGVFYSAIESSDGGFILAGELGGIAGVLKTNNAGGELWRSTTSANTIKDIEQVDSFIVVGSGWLGYLGVLSAATGGYVGPGFQFCEEGYVLIGDICCPIGTELLGDMCCPINTYVSNGMCCPPGTIGIPSIRECCPHDRAIGDFECCPLGSVVRNERCCVVTGVGAQELSAIVDAVLKKRITVSYALNLLLLGGDECRICKPYEVHAYGTCVPLIIIAIPLILLIGILAVVMLPKK